MFKKLHIRLTVVCTLVTGLVLLGMAGASLRFSQRQFAAQAEQAFSSELNAIFFHLNGQSYIDHTWLSQTEANNGILVYIEDRGTPINYSRNSGERMRLSGLARDAAYSNYGFDIGKPPANNLQPESLEFSLESEGITYRAAASKLPVGGGWLGLIVLKSTVAEQAQVVQLRLTFAAFVLLAIVCLLVFAWFFTSWAIRPVAESRQRQSEFISAASHELRSPLAVMQASAGAMQSAPLGQARAFARNMEGECTRLSVLVDDLLALAGADSLRWPMSWGLAEPETLLLTVSERFEPLAWKKGVSLAASLPGQPLPRVRCDAQRIQQLLVILLDNALEYSPSGGKIRISASRSGRRLHLSVADSGPGITDEQKKLVFQRFYKGDTSRTQKEHYGLGLSIAKEIAVLHKGSLTVSDTPEGGASFTLSLPLQQG